MFILHSLDKKFTSLIYLLAMAVLQYACKTSVLQFTQTSFISNPELLYKLARIILLFPRNTLLNSPRTVLLFTQSSSAMYTKVFSNINPKLLYTLSRT